MAGKDGRRGFGYIRKLPSGRFQASYVGPDLQRHTAPTTFKAKADAEAWLGNRRNEIHDGEWVPGQAARTRSAKTRTLGQFASDWLDDRAGGVLGNPMKPSTRAHYENLLEHQLAPLTRLPLGSLDEETVEAWFRALDPKRPTLRAHAYSLLRTLMNEAVRRRFVRSNPCNIVGGGRAKRATSTEPATLDELEVLTGAMPEHLRLLVLLTAWCALRFGEATELRRQDVDLRNGRLRIRRGVVLVKGERLVGTPKSTAGRRDVAIPPHLLPLVREHLAAHVSPGKDALLFPGGDGNHLAHSTLMWHWTKAREVADRPDLRFHDLRHTGAVLAAATGATLAELMARLGHSTPAAAMRYQHAARDADSRIAQALSALVSQE